MEVQLFKDKILGIGAYGKVCRARYGSLPCAAKVIHETLFDPEALKLVGRGKKHRLPFERFKQECEVLHNLRHPNIIQYLDVYQDPDTKLPVLLMELMDGSLTHFLEDSLQQIPFHIQVNFSHDIALALSFLHANKILHRDLSSNNVLLISNVRAKVTDFGMARLGEHATLISHTACPGTDVYMPPEAVKEKPTYTEKIDCFSFGVLIIQILAQVFPDPTKRQETMQNFSHRGRKVMVSVSEVERRKNHIDLVQPNHPLLAIALDCLNELESDRPSAQEICERVATLKESAEYMVSMKEEEGERKLESSRDQEQSVDESLARELREKEEVIEAERQETLKLQKALAAKEKEIEELKKKLAENSAANEPDTTKQPSHDQSGKEHHNPKLDFANYMTREHLDQQLGIFPEGAAENVQKSNQEQNQYSQQEAPTESPKSQPSQAPPPMNFKRQHSPPYTEIDPDQEIQLEPLPIQMSSATDSDMWVKVKHNVADQRPQQPDSIRLGRRSSSTSNLTNAMTSASGSDCLAELMINVTAPSTPGSNGQRRHSFTEGDGKLIIKASAANSDSIIPLGGHDYKNINLDFDEGGQLNNLREPVFQLQNCQGNDDHMNNDAEGIKHSYINENVLLEELGMIRDTSTCAENMPVADHDEPVEVSSADFTPQRRGRVGSIKPSIIKKVLEKVVKPKRPHSILSGNISAEQCNDALAPFTMTGIAIGQINCDYGAFFKTAWGSSPTSAPKTSAANLPQPPVPSAALAQPPDSPAESEHREEKEPRSSPPAGAVRRPLALKPEKPSAPTYEWRGPGEERPIIRQMRIPPSRPQPPRAPKPQPPPNMLRRPLSEAVVPKPKPHQKPYQDPSPVKVHQVTPSTAKDTMPYWYRPQYSRVEAVNFLHSLDPGSFIVRNSSSVSGGYALTMKVSPELVRRRRKMPEDAPVTEDMLITHFLIQPDPEGVKLQGWNERAFKTLPEFIAHHTVEKLCLPCKLVLPKSSAGSGGVPQVRRKPAGMKQALQTGAVCELVYLGSVEVSGPGSESVVRETVEQLKTLGLSTMNIVTFKASMSGIALTEDINGMYIKRQYPISSITYCGLDPNDTRWDFPNLQHLGETISLSNKQCFGLVLRPPDSTGNSCLVFGEFDSSQPVTSVVNYLQRVMRSR